MAIDRWKRYSSMALQQFCESQGHQSRKCVKKLAKIGQTAAGMSPKYLKIRPTSFLHLLYFQDYYDSTTQKVEMDITVCFLAVLGRVTAFLVGKLPKN